MTAGATVKEGTNDNVIRIKPINVRRFISAGFGFAIQVCTILKTAIDHHCDEEKIVLDQEAAVPVYTADVVPVVEAKDFKQVEEAENEHVEVHEQVEHDVDRNQVEHMIRDGMERVEWDRVGESIKIGVESVDWEKVGNSLEEWCRSVDWDGVGKSISTAFEESKW